MLFRLHETTVVVDARQALLGNCHDIVAGRLQQRPARLSEVLVQLELHSAAGSGTGTMRSRAISAA